MYRVLIAALVGAALAGCSVGTKPLSLTLNDDSGPNIDPNFVSASSLGDQAASTSPSRAAGAPSPGNTRLAALDTSRDRAPEKSVKKAPPGALADRNYQKTRLNVGAAGKMINAYRRKNGLKALTFDPQLTKAATAHSRDLAKWDRISHYGSDGSNPWDRVRRAGYKARLAAENVGTGQASLKEVFAGWKKSPSHNKNLLLKDARHMGIALVYDAKTEFKTFWTLVLGSKS